MTPVTTFPEATVSPIRIKLAVKDNLYLFSPISDNNLLAAIVTNKRKARYISHEVDHVLTTKAQYKSNDRAHHTHESMKKIVHRQSVHFPPCICFRFDLPVFASISCFSCFSICSPSVCVNTRKQKSAFPGQIRLIYIAVPDCMVYSILDHCYGEVSTSSFSDVHLVRGIASLTYSCSWQ